MHMSIHACVVSCMCCFTHVWFHAYVISCMCDFTHVPFHACVMSCHACIISCMCRFMHVSDVRHACDLTTVKAGEGQTDLGSLLVSEPDGLHGSSRVPGVVLCHCCC